MGDVNFDTRQAQEYIVQHGEYSQYFITVNREKPFKIVNDYIANL